MLITASGGLGLAGCTAPGRHPVHDATGGTRSVPAAGFCPVALPRQWRARLTAGRLAQRSGETLTVHAVGPDGGAAVVESRHGAGRSVVLLRRDTHGHDTRRTVLTLQRPRTDQLFGAAYDGRHLIFSISHDPADLAGWTLYGWDSRTGRTPRILAGNAVTSTGRPVDGPMPYPVISDGHAAWTTGDADGTTRLHRYDLATATDQVVRVGHAGAPFLLGHSLAWAESPAPDTLTELHAVSMSRGTPVAVPAALRTLRGPAYVAGSTRETLAWASPDVRTLWTWRAGWPAPVRAVTVAEGRNVQWVRVAGNLVTWDDGTAQFAADLRTGSYTRLTDSYGYTVASDDGLTVGYPPDRTVGRPPALVRVHELAALPRCR